VTNYEDFGRQDEGSLVEASKIVGSNHNNLMGGPIKLTSILNQGVLQHGSIMEVRKIVNME
jgi:hypothetical protein